MRPVRGDPKKYREQNLESKSVPALDQHRQAPSRDERDAEDNDAEETLMFRLNTRNDAATDSAVSKGRRC